MEMSLGVRLPTFGLIAKCPNPAREHKNHGGGESDNLDRDCEMSHGLSFGVSLVKLGVDTTHSYFRSMG